MELEPAAPVFGETPISRNSDNAPAADAEPTLAEHEAEFKARGRHDSRAPAPPAADAGTDGAPPSEGSATDADARDDKGRFKERHRAKSQQAKAADAPRIAELTRKLRETEQQLAEARTPRQSVQAAPQPPDVPRGTSAPSEQPPQLKTFLAALKTGEDYDTAVQQHAEALADWKYDQRDRQHAAKQAEQQFFDGFKSRVEAATAKYPDFKAVALDAPSRIPEGGAIDRWIWEHKLGPDVLYHFQKNDAELTRVLALPLLEQIEELALLGQRLAGPTRREAQPASAAPRPPNPIKTAPAKAAEDAPGDDISLAEHEKHYGSKRRR